MTTLEQVEKLRAMANISYDDARVALDATNGDLLEAVINLEKQGKLNAPTGDGYFSSEKSRESSSEGCNYTCGEQQTKHGHGGETFTELMKKFSKFLMKMIHKGNENSFEVLKGEESKASAPVTAFALLLVFAPWITIPLLVIGLFFGFRYRFNGPDLSRNKVNDAMNKAADAAVNLTKSMDK
ncbi:MAG TPA: ubiquitin [Desulfosporosinus sp.]|nr:ubiquitin [Desulfosporosinus sp.]